MYRTIHVYYEIKYSICSTAENVISLSQNLSKNNFWLIMNQNIYK